MDTGLKTPKPPAPHKPPPIMRYFAHAHLPPQLAEISRPFAELAEFVAGLPVGDPAERATALRKLLEAKDAAVRSVLP